MIYNKIISISKLKEIQEISIKNKSKLVNIQDVILALVRMDVDNDENAQVVLLSTHLVFCPSKQDPYRTMLIRYNTPINDIYKSKSYTIEFINTNIINWSLMDDENWIFWTNF